MNKTKLIALVLACVMCLGLFGCHTQQGSTIPTEPASSTQAATVETTSQPTAEPTVPAVTEPVLEAVNKLTARELSQTACVLDHRTVAFLSTEYISGEDAKTVTHVTVLDLYDDEIVAEQEYDIALALPLQTHCPGFLPLFDYASQTCTVYDRDLQPILSFQAPDRRGVFSEDISTYYYVSAQRLYRMDTKTGTAEQIITDQQLPLESIVGYDMENDRILVNVHTQYYLTELCAGVINLETGTYELLSADPDTALFKNDGIVLQKRTEDLIYSDLTWMDANGADVRVTTGVLPNGMTESSWHVPSSNYLLTLHYDASNAYSHSGTVLYRIGEGYESCDLGALLGKLELKTVLALPDGNLLGLARSRRNTAPVLICPDQLSFTPAGQVSQGEFSHVDVSIAEDYALQTQPVEVAQELSEVRAQADAMEEKYGITILISNQCEAPIANTSSNVVTTDQAGLKNEAELIEAALKELEDALKLYPEGFFRQFLNEAEERGMLVLLVQDIGAGTTAEGYDVLGISFRMDDWYPIAVDVTTWDMTATFCHEIWHATENKISSVDPMLFNDVIWGKINPTGFSYTDNGGGEFALDTLYTFVGGSGKASYFVDGYAKTSPKEDRARLMEYVMTSSYYSQNLMEAPALRKKMEVMSEAVRKIFDTTGWEEVHWERDLKR